MEVDFETSMDDTENMMMQVEFYEERRKNDKWAPLETLPDDEMDVILSFLSFTEYQKLCLVSHRLKDAVSVSSHLYVDDLHHYLSCLPQSSSPSNSASPTITTATTAKNHLITDLARTSKSMVEFLPPQEELRALLGRFHNLNVVQLSGLSIVGDDIVSILNKSPSASRMKQITLHGCSLSYWCNEAFQLTNLQHITIMGGGSIRARISTLLQNSKQLQSLCIEQCSTLRDDCVNDMVPILRHTLQSLTLHQCIRIRSPTLQFPLLTNLNLAGCFALSQLPNLHCPNLRSMDLSFCVRLTGEEIEQLISNRTLYNLQELIMIKCAGLQTLNLISSTLQRINVSFCSNLKELKLDCPNLQFLEVSVKNFQTFFFVFCVVVAGKSAT